jgi:hypothetical protein
MTVARVAPPRVALRDEDEATLLSWLNPAFNSIGLEDSSDYLKTLCRKHSSEQGFVVIVAKLPMPHYAFARDSEVTLSYACGRYGIGNMHALLIHEVCHVFGAADEAGECHCGELHGYLKVPHANCSLCNPHPEPCIMAANAVSLCSSTRRQIGWDQSLFPSATSFKAKPGMCK